MNFDSSAFANEMLEKTLWWRYSIKDDKQVFALSEALQALFVNPICQLDDLTGQYTTPLIKIKIQEVLDNPSLNKRFVASYSTRAGKQSFQHRLQVYETQGIRYVWATCVDVSEMVELEREMVDSQGRLSLNQVYAREAQLVEQNKFITDSYQKQSRFLAMLSHELRSPLLGISSLAERLKEQLMAESISDATLTALKTIHVTAEQSIFLVNDILTYSQTEYDEITLHPMVFSLKEVLENVKQLTKSIATDKNLIVSMVYLGERDQVVGDSVRLSQILINLIVNSLKFTQFGGVSIEVNEKADSHFLFKITDSGEGISAEKQARIFEPFVQLESRGSGLSIGSGLGLFVVKQLVQLMGGDISVKSILGVSTTFYVDLILPKSGEATVEKNKTNILAFASQPPAVQIVQSPLNLQQFTSKQSTTKAFQSKNADKNRTNSATEHYKILVADDSKINRMVLAGYLEQANCTVFEAKDGRQAWELFQKEVFDFVFLDIQMPFLDGIEVSQKIRQSVEQNSEYAQNLKGVFAITAGGEESNFIPQGESLASIGFDRWFVKPVTQSQIIGLLQERDAIESQERTATAVQKKVVQVALETAENIAWDTFEKVPIQFHALMDSFLSEVKEGLGEMLLFIQSNDGSALAAKAHYLKGNCMLFQLDNMVGLFRTVEEIIKNEENPQLKQQKLDLVLEKLQFSLKYLEKSLTISHNG